MDKFKIQLFNDCFVFYRNYTRANIPPRKRRTAYSLAHSILLSKSLNLKKSIKNLKSFLPMHANSNDNN